MMGYNQADMFGDSGLSAAYGGQSGPLTGIAARALAPTGGQGPLAAMAHNGAPAGGGPLSYADWKSAHALTPPANKFNVNMAIGDNGGDNGSQLAPWQEEAFRTWNGQRNAATGRLPWAEYTLKDQMQSYYNDVAAGKVRVDDFNTLLTDTDNGISSEEFSQLPEAVQAQARANPQAFLQSVLHYRNRANNDLMSTGAEGGFGDWKNATWNDQQGLVPDRSKFMQVNNSGNGVWGSIFGAVDPILDKLDPMHDKVQQYTVDRWMGGKGEGGTSGEQANAFSQIAPAVVDYFLPGVGSYLSAADEIGKDDPNWGRVATNVIAGTAGVSGATTGSAAETLAAETGLTVEQATTVLNTAKNAGTGAANAYASGQDVGKGALIGAASGAVTGALGDYIKGLDLSKGAQGALTTVGNSLIKDLAAGKGDVNKERLLWGVLQSQVPAEFRDYIPAAQKLYNMYGKN